MYLVLRKIIYCLVNVKFIHDEDARDRNIKLSDKVRLANLFILFKLNSMVHVRLKSRVING
jgi:hypothetical protein